MPQAPFLATAERAAEASQDPESEASEELRLALLILKGGDKAVPVAADIIAR